MGKLIITEEQYKKLNQSIIDWDLSQRLNDKKYGKRKIDVSINKNFESKPLNEARKTIDIEQDYYDERSNRKSNRYRVKYQIVFKLPSGGKTIELEGELIPYHTGRAEEYEFQPTWYMDNDSEKYYDEHWEEIEDEILNKFYNM